jgi:hypothetical protein
VWLVVESARKVGMQPTGKKEVRYATILFACVHLVGRFQERMVGVGSR